MFLQNSDSCHNDLILESQGKNHGSKRVLLLTSSRVNITLEHELPKLLQHMLFS